MTQEEKEFCENCPHHNDCGFISRRLEYKCDKLDDFLSGWEKAIDKAVGWLEKKAYLYVWKNCEQGEHGIHKAMLEDFRKAMEGGEQ
jgi:hypothetical protein